MEIVSRCAPGCCVGDDAWPSTPSEIVGWEMGARTCLHVRPGRLTILECRFNKTTHHQEWYEGSYLSFPPYEGASCFLKTRGRSLTPRGCCRALAAWDSVVVVPSHPCPPTPQLQIKPRNVHEHPSVAISKNIGTNPLCFSSCPGNPPNYAP
jgi:hypothetical protein